MDTTDSLTCLKEIFQAALNRVDHYRMIIDHVQLSGSSLRVDLESQHLAIDLDMFRQVFVIGAGKAAARMAKAVEEIQGNRIHEGVIVVKYKYAEPLKIIKTLQAGHPVPDDNGLAAARTSKR